MTRQHWMWLGVIVVGLVGFAVYQEHRNPGVAGGVSWGTAFGNMLEHFHLGNWAPFGRTNVVKMPAGGTVNLGMMVPAGAPDPNVIAGSKV